MEADEERAASNEDEEDEATEEAVKGRPPACGAMEEEGRHMSGLVSAVKNRDTKNRQVATRGILSTL